MIDPFDRIFVVTSFTMQFILLIYFMIRKLNFELAIRWGWVVYTLAVPPFVVSLILLQAGKPLVFWLGGFLFTFWAIFGYIVDIARPVAWRSPAYLPILIPYIALYLGAQMFYWFPIGTLQRSFWYFYAVLFVASTYFNLTSHQYR